MLSELHIRDFAIIERASVEFETGMTVLTGETGAGKSIVLDALSLVLGERASATVIRQGARRAEVTARVQIEALPAVRAWLEAAAIDEGDECVLRRVVDTGGRSRASINARPVTVQQLATLGRQLVLIHGQHAHQSLVRGAEQRGLLDRFAPTPLLDEMASRHADWQSAQDAWETQRADADRHQQRLDLLSFQLQEFDEIDIGHLTPEAIEEEHRWRANTETLREHGNEALEALESRAGPALQEAIRHLEALVALDESLREALDLVDSAAIQSDESASQLRQRVSDFDQDEQRLAWLDKRLGDLHRLAKKHRCELSELAEREEALRAEHDTLTDPDASIGELERQRDASLSACVDTAERLGRHRRRAAQRLSATVSDSLQALAMPGARLMVDIAEISGAPQAHGSDAVSFLIRSHAGGSAEPIARIASGGELSRIGLCLQLALLGRQAVPTLLFDEVDAGIGGAVADTVGQRLRALGQEAQVLCVTHLAQVAAQAHHHLRVEKSVAATSVETGVSRLQGPEVREEIARMLGGQVTARSRQHAEELLNRATTAREEA